MKLSLGAVLAPVLALGIAMTTGCAGAAQSATPASAASTPIGTTSLTSATLTPSSLAPATWDGDEVSGALADRAPRVAQPTWGTTVVVSSPATPAN